MIDVQESGAEPRATAPRWRRAGLRLLMSVLVLGVLLVVLRGEEVWSELRAFAADAPGAWCGALAAFLGLHLFGAYKWRLFMKLAGARIGRLEAVRFYGSGLFANLCLPSLIGGDVLRAGLALGVTDNEEGVVLGSVVDRLADLTALAVLVALGGVLSAGGFETLRENSIGPGAILAAYVGILAFVAGVAAFALRPSRLRRWPRGVARRLVGVLRGLRALRRNPIDAAFGFSACLVLQAGFVFVNDALGQRLGIDLGLELWILLWPLAKIVAMLPISLGGLGVRELAFASLVAPFGVARETAVAQSLVWQSVLVVGGILAGLFALVTRRRP